MASYLAVAVAESNEVPTISQCTVVESHASANNLSGADLAENTEV